MIVPFRAPFSREINGAILGLGLTQIIGWGTTYYLLSLLGGRIGDALGMSKPGIVAGVSMTLAVAAFLGPWIGRWQDQRGSREVMGLGSLIMAAGLAVLAFATTPVGYYFGWGIIALGTPMSLYTAAFTAMTQLAGRDARQAIIYLTFLGGLASTIAWPTTALLLHWLDWRGIVLLFAILNAGICCPLHVWLLPSRRKAEQEKAILRGVSPGLSVIAQRPAFWLLAGMLAINSILFTAWSILVFPVLEAIGFTGQEAVAVASMVGICQVLGRMGEMALGGRFTALQTATFAISLIPLSVLVLAFSNGSFVLGLAFSVIYGVSNGLVTIARGALTLVIFGSGGYGERFGKVTLASGLCGAASPVLGGFLLQQGGAWAMISMLMLAACLSLGLMLALVAHCHRHGLR